MIDRCTRPRTEPRSLRCLGAGLATESRQLGGILKQASTWVGPGVGAIARPLTGQDSRHVLHDALSRHRNQRDAEAHANHQFPLLPHEGHAEREVT